MLRERVTQASQYSVRAATRSDLPAIQLIYNEGIEDRIATLDTELKSDSEIFAWFNDHDGRYAVLVAEGGGDIVGWTSLNRYSHRCAYDGVADLSIYVRRDKRGTGVGSALMQEIEEAAKTGGFHKIVLFAFPTNEAGRRLYLNSGFADVGRFREQGQLDNKYIDVIAMEKILASD
ncbi:MAG: N-acetyltransferase [Acidobacteriaceae bacterium]|nr:N-acetyltransferase [Acidobacteriaceae bacterium]